MDRTTPPLDADEVHVWRIPLDVDADCQAEAMACLNPDEQRRTEGYVRPQDRRRWPLSRAGMRRILALYLRCAPRDLTFETSAEGKPLLPGASLGFNLSHSDAWALLAVARQSTVGVDVEQERPLADLDGLCRQLFSPRERDALASVRIPREREAAFFLTWVHKEALVKAMGMGLGRALPSLELQWDAQEPGLASTEGWSSRSLLVAPGYSAAVAMLGPPLRISLNEGPNCQGAPSFPL